MGCVAAVVPQPFVRIGDNLWADGNQGREPWRFTPWQNWSLANNNNQGADGTNYCALMQKNIQFRYELMPYLYTLMYNDTINGTPMDTPVAFNYLRRQQHAVAERV
jgi:alpha-glucosidase (family GH31 glycosyl hydrolase)